MGCVPLKAEWGDCSPPLFWVHREELCCFITVLEADFRYRQKWHGEYGGFSCQSQIIPQGLPNGVDFLLVCEALF